MSTSSFKPQIVSVLRNVCRMVSEGEYNNEMLDKALFMRKQIAVDEYARHEHVH